MATIDRRTFLGFAAGTAGSSMAGFAVLQGLGVVRPATAGRRVFAEVGEGSYGRLEPAGPHLALPPGFQYRRFGVAGTIMRDGFPTPSAHDGMAAFPLPNGNVRLIRNHEVGSLPEEATHPEPAYDPIAGGGTTSVEIDPVTREVIRDFVSLSGTVLNCAGGPTPWGSWLSCEETIAGVSHGATRPHGYVFEVRADAEGPVDPVPLRAMGRFVHEALAVDPATGVIYLTEDQPRAGLYRFLPDRPYRGPGQAPRLEAGGLLQMAAIRDAKNLDCATGRVVGQRLAVHWVDIDEPDPETAEENPAAVFEQGWRQGGARFIRMEGCWWGDGGAYFSCTTGGDAQEGQIWHYRPHGKDRGELTLIFESPSPEILDYPDNLTVSPRGGIVICEDGTFRNFVRGLTPEGAIFDFAENVGAESEITGPTFGPDGNTLFLNLQWNPGATFAIWGPWERGGL